jgi:hypothetical protein
MIKTPPTYTYTASLSVEVMDSQFINADEGKASRVIDKRKI